MLAGCGFGQVADHQFHHGAPIFQQVHVRQALGKGALGLPEHRHQPNHDEREERRRDQDLDEREAGRAAMIPGGIGIQPR